MKWKILLPILLVALLVFSSVGTPLTHTHPIHTSEIKSTVNHIYSNPQYLVMKNAVWVGVPGDYYNFNGSYTRPTDGFAILDVDDINNDGVFVAKVKNNSDIVTIVAVNFTGYDGGVKYDVELHGTTGRGDTGLSDYPRVYAYVAAWGYADVYVNDTLTYNDLSIEVMFTRGIRSDTTRAVNESSGINYFDPTDLDDVYTYTNDRELHVILHSTTSDPNNNPPFATVLNLYFEEIDNTFNAVGFNAHKIGALTDYVSYDGALVSNVGGYAIVDVNATTDTGFIVAQIVDGTHLYTVVFDNFTGYDGGIAENVTIFGNTNLSIAEYPNVTAYLVAFGAAAIYKDGVLLYDNLNATVALTQGFRNDLTHAIYNSTETGFFNPNHPDNVSIDAFDIEMHIILHSNTPSSTNKPPYTIVYNYMFEDVKMLSEEYQLQALRYQVDSLINQVTYLQTQMELIGLNNTALYNQLEVTRTELESVKQELNDKNATLTELQSEVAELRERVNNLTEQVEELQQKTIEQRDNLIVGLFAGIFIGAIGSIALMYVLSKYVIKGKS